MALFAPLSFGTSLLLLLPSSLQLLLLLLLLLLPPKKDKRRLGVCTLGLGIGDGVGVLCM